jgi:hypothetical protein
MATKFYNIEKAAEVLGVTHAEINAMRERQQLHGYRDGADWKFKAEAVDSLAKQRQSQPPAAEDEDGGDVLLSEVALGQSDPGASGTVIGMDAGGRAAADSDIRLADSHIKLGEESKASGAAKKKDEVDSKVAQFEELDLTLEEDLTLEDSSVGLGTKPAVPSGAGAGSGSAVDLSGKGLEDDDLVLGGSGTGSDVTIGHDSGISLVDPSDSGLSLEHPLDLSGAGEESLELGEDDMLTVGEGADTAAATQLKTDDDFLLTPLADAGEEDDSESGSQVIALDTEGDDAATMISSGAGVSMAAMLDEDLSAQPALDMGLGAPMTGAAVLGPQPGGFAEGAPLMQPAAVLPEAPYTGWQIAGLVFCALLLMLCGMMMYDLLRNMWSWQGTYTVNSSIMDTILTWFEK